MELYGPGGDLSKGQRSISKERSEDNIKRKDNIKGKVRGQYQREGQRSISKERTISKERSMVNIIRSKSKRRKRVIRYLVTEIISKDISCYLFWRL